MPPLPTKTARRAVHAARMQRLQDFGRDPRHSGASAEMRTGINTGLVVGKIGDDLRTIWRGDTTNPAARLQQLAQPDCGQRCHPQARGRLFWRHNLGEHVKAYGVGASMKCRGRAGAHPPEVAAERGLTPRVGVTGAADAAGPVPAGEGGPRAGVHHWRGVYWRSLSLEPPRPGRAGERSPGRRASARLRTGDTALPVIDQLRANHIEEADEPKIIAKIEEACAVGAMRRHPPSATCWPWIWRRTHRHGAGGTAQATVDAVLAPALRAVAALILVYEHSI